MAASDVIDTLEDALNVTGLTQARVQHKLRLLSDNGPCYISGELKAWLKNKDIAHTRGAPYHPMTQGKIECYHRSMKNVIKLEHYYFPGEFVRDINRWPVVIHPLLIYYENCCLRVVEFLWNRSLLQWMIKR